MKALFRFVIIFITGYCYPFQQAKLPENFVYIDQVIPDIILDMRYAGNNNFIGKPITGYLEPKAILTKPAAKALQKVQLELEDMGYCLKIYDAYRPQRAVDQFVEWARNPGDTLMKNQFYPEEKKKDLFNRGFLASRSGHSRGSTLDLTLVEVVTGKEVDMGGAYDFFGEVSRHNYPHVTSTQKKNRELLKNIMSKYGFRPYPKEWWHYTYREEPFPETYFDFPVE